MGLCDEEREEKFIFACIHMRRKFQDILDRFLKKKERFYEDEIINLVQSWIQKIDFIQGKYITSTNASGGYWLFGSPSGNYQSHFTDHYNLAQEHPDRRNSYSLGDYKMGTMPYFKNIPFDEFIDKLVPGNEDESDLAFVIGRFWQAFEFIDFALYAKNRYQDRLFSVVEEDFTTFIGFVSNTRFDLFNLANGYGSEISYSISAEIVLLNKHKLFKQMMNEESINSWKKVEEIKDKEEEKTKRNQLLNGICDKGWEILDEVRKMPLSLVEKKLEEKEKKDCEEENNTSKSYKGESKTSRIFGPIPPSYEELDSIASDPNTPPDIYNNVVDELEKYYNTFTSEYSDEEIKEYYKSKEKEENKQTTKKTSQKKTLKKTPNKRKK